MKTTIYPIFFLLILACGKNNGGVSNEPAPTKQIQDSGRALYRPFFKYEHAYLSLDKRGAKASFEDEKYTAVIVARDEKETKLNYKTFEKGLRSVKIEGLQVVLGGENSHPGYDLIRKATDIKELKISAHTLIIQDEIHVAQAKVVLEAQKLVFEGKGKIVTTPVEKTELPAIKTDGVDGLNAGPIFVSAKEISIHHAFPVLVANGGEGQPAGPGLDGGRGHDAKIVARNNIHFFQKTATISGGRRRGDRYKTETKKGRRAGNGQNAQAGGRPGRGGEGGMISVNGPDANSIMTSNTGGIHGKPDIFRKGGAPGRPATTCARINGKTKDCVTATKGADAAPHVLNGSKGWNGAVIRRPVGSYYSDHVAFHLGQHAKDMYLARHVKEAERAFNYLRDYAAKIGEESPVLSAALEDADTHLQKIGMRLDFFGNSQTWTPKISFPVAEKLFKTEGSRNLKLYFLSAYFKEQAEEASLDYGKLKDLQDELLLNIEAKRENVTKHVNDSVKLAASLEELETARDEFEFELKLLEAKIQRMAKQNLRIPFLEKAAGFISAASKAIPVGQPTFGAAGLGLDFLTETLKEKRNVRAILGHIPSLADSFKGFDWRKANEELNEKLNRLDPREFGKLGSNKEKLEYLEEVGAFASPLAKAVSDQTRQWKEREVSKSALQEEMNKIRSSHKVYQKVMNKLDKLLAKKEEFLILAKALNSSIRSELNDISQNYTALAYIYDDIHQLQGQFKAEFQKAMVRLEARAKDRINYYAYVLSKAFQYQYLTGHISEINLDNFYKRAKGLLVQDGVKLSDMLGLLNELFLDEQSKLVKKTTLFSAARHSLEKTIQLSKAQMEAINRGEDIYLDFTSLEFFGDNKENIRLLGVELAENSLLYQRSRSYEVVFEHVGESIVYKNGSAYFFSHNDSTGAFKWISSVQGGFIHHSGPSVSNGEDLRSSLDLPSDTQVFALPGGRSFIKMSASGKEPKLKEAFVRIEYSFEHN